MDSDSENDKTCIPPNISECAEAKCQNLIPANSREKYEAAYKKFTEWCDEKKITTISEMVMIAYMTNLSKKIKPSTLWTTYSMLRTTLSIRQNVQISKYYKLRNFLKLQSTGYKKKKSKMLSTDQIKKFIEEAPDKKFLFTKVVLIIGISGGCRRQELKNLLVSHVRDLGSELLVKLVDTKTKTTRTFIITGIFYEICKKYMSIRPPNMEHFFLNYQNGKCVRQVVGINKIGEQPKIIARYLGLPDANLFTGHCFRRSGATILRDSDEMLIEFVKNKPSLYSDNISKRKLWNEIGKAVGQPEEEAINENNQQLDGEDVESATASPQLIIDDNDIPPVNTFTRFTTVSRKIKIEPNLQSKDASTTLLKHLLEKQEAERTPHPMDSFFSLMAATVKNFSTTDQHYIKHKVFNLVHEIEERYLPSSSSPANAQPSASTS